MSGLIIVGVAGNDAGGRGEKKNRLSPFQAKSALLGRSNRGNPAAEAPIDLSLLLWG